MPVPAIILAAGASSRLGQPKQLLLHEGETLLERAARLAAEAGAVPVVAILGARFIEICAAIPQNRDIRVFNEKWEKGIATSIHAGLHALDTVAPLAPAALLLTCDQPRLTATHLHTLLELFAAQQTPAIVASSYAGTVGTPAVFPRTVFAKLLALRGDRGARSLLARPPCALIQVDFPGGEIDIDTPEDLARLT